MIMSYDLDRDPRYIVRQVLAEMTLDEISRLMFDKYCLAFPERRDEFMTLVKLYDENYIRVISEIMRNVK